MSDNEAMTMQELEGELLAVFEQLAVAVDLGSQQADVLVRVKADIQKGLHREQVLSNMERYALDLVPAMRTLSNLLGQPMGDRLEAAIAERERRLADAD